MRFRIVPRSIPLLLGLLALLPSVRALDVPPLEQAPNDTSEYRRFVLDNGMKVILLSDPKLNKSAASVSVGVGSLSDPAERQGLAHFLEHMLFLGTEKYPDEAEYGNYLRSNGGYSNAYTAGDHTNYHFEIRHEAFEGAIDRFSQFFIAPLFTPEFTEREMNAVNSENQKNLENDMWREYQLSNSLYRKGHPANHFSTGSRATLAGTTQEELLAFYRKHYSANTMTLALTGKASLDQLEAWVRSYFNPVVNRNLEAIRFPADYLLPKAALRLVQMEPVKDLLQLSIEFPLPGTRQDWSSKSGELLGYILGYEGEGSLLSKLKAEGLATTLGAGAYEATADFGTFNVTIGLTPEGREHYHRVLTLLFATVDGIKRAPYPEYLFEERRTLARLDERFQDKGEGTERAVGLANRLRDYPMEYAERVPFLWIEPDGATFARVLDQIRPDNMLVTLIAKGVETDAVEPVYGTRYSYQEITDESYEALLDPPGIAEIHYPKENPFIPSRANLLALQPVRLIDDAKVSLYYSQDTEFARPMVTQVHRFRLARSAGTLENAVLLRFYEACVNEALNEIAYTARSAGLDLSVTAALEGVQVTINGYDESADRLVAAVTAKLLNIDLPAERFAAIKDRLVRDLRNFPKADAWQILLETRRSVVREYHFRPDEQLAVAEKVTLAQVKAFPKKLFARGKLESLVHGNVSAAQAIAATRQVADTLKAAAVPDADLLRRRLLTQPAGELLSGSEKLEVNNSAYREEFILGGDEPEVRAATLVLANFIGEPYYTEMRTRQQLGYIVFGGAGDEERTNFAYFIIQSGDHPADALAERSRAFLTGLPAMLSNLPDEAWEMIVAGSRSTLEEKDKTIAERAARLFSLAYNYGGDWSRREATLAALDSLTRERAVEILTAALDPARARGRTFLGFARQHEPAGKVTNVFDARAAWKKKRTYR